MLEPTVAPDISKDSRIIHQEPPPSNLLHPRRLGWLGTSAIAMGGSNQSIFLMSALLIGQENISGQGSVAILLLIVGIILSWAAAPGWTELVLMFPNRVGGITATCAEAFRPYSDVLSNLTGTLYWWGWVPTCGISALLSATAIHEWYMPWMPVYYLATILILIFTWVNLRGIYFAAQVAIPIAFVSASLALLSGIVPIFAGQVNWVQATTFHLTTPFPGLFGQITSLMAGLYLIGFAAPAFEQATCHVGETKNPNKNVPRAIFASAVMGGVYFILLPVVWLGVLGVEPLSGNLGLTLGPTFAPLLGAAAKAAAIWFLAFNMFHDTLAPLAGATRTLMQLSEDGLLPKFLAKRNAHDAPSISTIVMMVVAIGFLWYGEPLWLLAAANFTYLISICMVSVAVWLLRRDQPHLERPYRAPRGTIGLGLIAAGIWALSIVLGFEQFGLPTVILAICFAYSGSVLYAWRKASDRKALNLPPIAHTLHIKLTGAMLLVLTLDGIGYFLAVQHVPHQDTLLISALTDIFVAVAILTIAVGLILPGMIAHSVTQVTKAAKKIVRGTLTDFSHAMIALGRGDLEAAHAQIDMIPVIVHSRDEISDMALAFNSLQFEIMTAATGLDAARKGLSEARAKLVELNETLEQRVADRTEQLEKTQQKLLTVAHQAGMAEVATNVLHNIGNVLNSVNVAVNYIKEEIGQSKLNKLVSLSAIIKEHKENLVHFLTQDQKGTQIPAYLTELANYWQQEQNTLTKELDELSSNIQHIKDTISAQQSLSGVSGVEQVVDLELLIEDALKINAAKKSEITVEKEYEFLKPIIIDKIKLLQILINLIQNAGQALIESSKNEKILKIKIKQTTEQTIAIEISDNGIGIPSENLTRIFVHGFTTKKQGHGFGLHSCALAAKEMHGQLQAYSEGLEKGALFVLELPCKLAKSGS